MRDLYRETFDEIHASEALRREVLNMTKREKAAVKRQVPKMLLIAAVIVLALAGTTLAVTFSGMQEWFNKEWTKETGQTIHKDQMGLIDRLTDEIGVSAKAGGITMTLDSVTRGEGILWMLLEIDGLPPEEELEAQLGQYARPVDASRLPEGYQPSPMRDYNFLDYQLALATEDGDILLGLGYEQAARREDGTLSVLMRCETPVEAEVTLLDTVNLALRLGSLDWGGRITVGRIPLAEGPWEFTFTLPAKEEQPYLTTGPCNLPGYLPRPNGWDTQEMGPPPQKTAAFRDIQVTPTDCTMFWVDPNEAKEIHLGSWMSLVMKDGTELNLDSSGDFYETLPDGAAVRRKPWPVPVDLSQAVALRYHFEGEEFLLELK